MTEQCDRFPDREVNSDAETLAIRRLNDQLRQTFSGGQVLMTTGVQALADATIANVLTAVRDFEDFTEDNDPYGTHEFGMLDVDDHSIMWKVDAYDQNLEYGSPDPANPDVTSRVLTILLASEY